MNDLESIDWVGLFSCNICKENTATNWLLDEDNNYINQACDTCLDKNLIEG